jgi:hypothetical protein
VQLDLFQAQHDLAFRNARHVEQVVDQVRQVVDLARDDFARAQLRSTARRVPCPAASPRCGSALSGLRSSCASVARNSFLLLSAARSSRSISLRCVMSLVMRAMR